MSTDPATPIPVDEHTAERLGRELHLTDQRLALLSSRLTATHADRELALSRLRSDAESALMGLRSEMQASMAAALFDTLSACARRVRKFGVQR